MIMHRDSESELKMPTGQWQGQPRRQRCRQGRLPVNLSYLETCDYETLCTSDDKLTLQSLPRISYYGWYAAASCAQRRYKQRQINAAGVHQRPLDGDVVQQSYYFI